MAIVDKENSPTPVFYSTLFSMTGAERRADQEDTLQTQG